MCAVLMCCKAVKQLTIAVPAYNARAYIGKCLDSMVGQDDRLEIIVIDDGSTDDTAAIARSYGEAVRVVSQPNGGHGSGINRAVELATGRYFKVVDSDDWIESGSLKSLLDALEATTADTVITGYRTVNMKSGKFLDYSSQCKYSNREIGLEALLEVYNEISSCCSLHGLCYRTEMYRSAGIHLSEGIFYEDQEYATLPFAYVEKVLILPQFFYVYQIGNADQSVSFPNQVKRIGHIEAVTRSILAYRAKNSPLTSAREEYFLRKLAVVAVSYFAVALIKNPDKHTGRKDALRFRAWLAEDAPELLMRIKKKYATLELFSRLRISPELYQGMLDTRLYKVFRRLWMSCFV